MGSDGFIGRPDYLIKRGGNERDMEKKASITIDGRPYPFDEGETILSVAKRNGIDIPTLCHLAKTTPTGACRICMVEVEKARTLMAACALPATDGMVVLTESPKVVKSRRMTLELLLSSGQHDCVTCTGAGECRLQELCMRYGVTGKKFAPTPPRYTPESENPFIMRNFAKCILCGRCVQACNDVQVNNAISFGYRGKKSKIVAAEDLPLKDSQCVFCGECVQACPTNALMYKNANLKIRPWEGEKVRTTCSYCGVGCQMWLHVLDNRIVKVTGVTGVGPNHGSLCVKGRFGYDFVGHPDRLTTPLIREGEGFREASWDEALDLVAKRLGNIRDTAGPDSIGVLTSARVTNEANYVVQKFARAVLKTNNVDHCARL